MESDKVSPEKEGSIKREIKSGPSEYSAPAYCRHLRRKCWRINSMISESYVSRFCGWLSLLGFA